MTYAPFESARTVWTSWDILGGLLRLLRSSVDAASRSSWERDVGAGSAAPRGKRELRSEEHTSELQSHLNLVCRLLLEKKNSSRTYPGVFRIRGITNALH